MPVKRSTSKIMNRHACFRLLKRWVDMHVHYRSPFYLQTL